MFEFVHQTMVTLAIHGNAYIYAPKGNNGLPVEMRNLHPHEIKNVVYNDLGEVIYEVGRNQFTRISVDSWLIKVSVFIVCPHILFCTFWG